MSCLRCTFVEFSGGHDAFKGYVIWLLTDNKKKSIQTKDYPVLSTQPEVVVFVIMIVNNVIDISVRGFFYVASPIVFSLHVSEMYSNAPF